MRCPLLPVAPLPGGTPYSDTDEPLGFVSQLQHRLQELGVTDASGQMVRVTGVYDFQTQSALALWMSGNPARWPSSELVRVTRGYQLADCRVWRALGLDCDEVFVTPATPAAEAIAQAVQEGRLELRCRLEAPESSGLPAWLWGIALAAGAVLFLSWRAGGNRS